MSATTTSRIAEVQSLRGLAVLAVLLFHVDIPGVHGGFLGVDMFFVISGYVICALLRRDIAAGGFSFPGFYRRRAWRLLPALVATLVATAAAFGLLLPSSLNPTLVPSLMTSAFGVANLYFAGNLDYFDSGLSNPLLHMWSLGVEEQFYLVFPLLMVGLLRGRAGKIGGSRPGWWLAVLCPQPTANCAGLHGDDMLYSDKSHFTPQGAGFVATRLPFLCLSQQTAA